MDQSHRIILTLTQRHAGFDITLSHGKVEENAHRAADMVGSRRITLSPEAPAELADLSDYSRLPAPA